MRKIKFINIIYLLYFLLISSFTSLITTSCSYKRVFKIVGGEDHVKILYITKWRDGIVQCKRAKYGFLEDCSEVKVIYEKESPL